MEQAVSGLAQDGKVVSVRLALFAEMVKSRPWTPTTLKAIGGIEGVGVTFLEETFYSPQADPRYQQHQKAAQAVLKTLLPESGLAIGGNRRSQQTLLEMSGYVSRLRSFNELLRILDGELRLITPTEPEEISVGERRDQQSPGEKYYQLTHDYLVPSIREWLTHKQKETWKGQAELRLAERSALWNVKPVNRYLPSLWEWGGIRLLTRKKKWTEPQRKMMRRAGRVHGLRGLLTFALLTAGVLAGIAARRQVIENQSSIHAAGLVQRLLDADTPQVPDIVGAMRDYRQWVDSSLRSELEKRSDDSRQKLHASLALLPVDATQVDYLYKRLTALSQKTHR